MKPNKWIYKTKPYINDPVIDCIDLTTGKSVFWSRNKYILIAYPEGKRSPRTPLSLIFAPFGDHVKFYCGVHYHLEYDLMQDIYFHNTIAQMVNIYQELIIPNKYLEKTLSYLYFGIVPSFVKRRMQYIIQYRDLFPPLTVNSNTNIYYKYEDKNQRRIYNV